MGGPDFAGGRIEGDGFGVGDVVAELRGFAGVDNRRRSVKRANREFRATESFDCGLVIGAALFGGFCSILLLDGTVGRVAGEQDKGEVERHAERGDAGIENRFSEKRSNFGLGGRGLERRHRYWMKIARKEFWGNRRGRKRRE